MQRAKLIQNMFAKFIDFYLKSRFLNNCIICSNDVIIQNFKILENLKKKKRTNEVQKEYCIVFQNKRQTIPSQCLYLSIQGSGSKTNTLHEIFYGVYLKNFNSSLITSLRVIITNHRK